MSMRGHYRKSPVGSKHKNESKKLKRGRMKRAVGVEGQGEQGMSREVRMKEKHMARWKKEKKRETSTLFLLKCLIERSLPT